MKTFLFQGDSITDAGRNRDDYHDLGMGYPFYASKYIKEENYFKDALDVEKNRLNAPTFVKVVNGEMTMYHINTVDTHVLNENMVLPPLTDTQLKELKDILNKFFN